MTLVGSDHVTCYIARGTEDRVVWSHKESSRVFEKGHPRKLMGVFLGPFPHPSGVGSQGKIGVVEDRRKEWFGVTLAGSGGR